MEELYDFDREVKFVQRAYQGVLVYIWCQKLLRDLMKLEGLFV